MIILGIETSCDETAASVVEGEKSRRGPLRILSHVLATSADMHAKTGGIIPEVAAREQVRSILPIIQEAIENCKLKIENLDAIAVTMGPGLIGSLLVGVETARTLAYVWNKPIVPVNHLVGHIYANFIREFTNSKHQIPNEPQFPALALVVSGGHTDLVLMRGHSDMKWIGGTRDDAAGEAFDKTARLLGLPYPGGPAIAAAAADYKLSRAEGTSFAYPGGPAIAAAAAAKFEARNPKFELKLFPRPMIDEENFDWSFSGLKTAVGREFQKRKKITEEDKKQFAAEIQEAIVDVLVTKTIRAAKKFKPKSLLLGGGVAANQRLREEFKLKIENLKLKINLHVPQPLLCTDNASYIAAVAYYNYKPVPWRKITAKPDLTIMGDG